VRCDFIWLDCYINPTRRACAARTGRGYDPPVRLLLTGFAPFGGEAFNPSWEVARALRDAPPEGVDVAATELPIRAQVAREVLWPAWRAQGFDVWLGLGQAGGRAQICVERVALNLFHGRGEDGPALAGAGSEEPIVAGAPDAYLCRVRAQELAAAIQASGAPASVSYSAGTYLCNQVLYVMEHELRARRSGAQAVFLHLPYMPEQLAGKLAATPSLPLAAQLAGVRAALVWLRDQVSSRGVG
jgi:pyroglutamyl-peptidase